MKIADRTAESIETKIKVQVLYDSEIYNFTAVVYTSEKHNFVTDIHYLDGYEKPMKNSVKKKIRNFLSEELLK